MENISMTQVLICAAGLALSTTIGSILGFFIKEVPHKWNDAILGYCAGVMLAASTIGLIVPAAESAGPGKWWLVLGGVIAGMLFLNVLDVFIPHMLQPRKLHGRLYRPLSFFCHGSC